MRTYLIMIFKEHILIHCGSYRGWRQDAKENAVRACLWLHGDEWIVDEVEA